MYCTLLPSFVFFVGDRCAFASTWRVSLLFLSPSLNLVMLNVGKGRKKSPLYFLCGGGRRGDTISTDISWIICPKLILYSDLVGAKKC